MTKTKINSIRWAYRNLSVHTLADATEVRSNHTPINGVLIPVDDSWQFRIPESAFQGFVAKLDVDGKEGA